MKKLIVAMMTSLVTLAATAQPFPSKPITLVVPFPPGGSTDLIARVLAPKLQERLGASSVVVDNRGGATGTIGTGQVAKAPADGHTLLVSSLGPFVIAPHLIKAPYDALKDLDPITIIVQAPNVLVVPAASPHKTMADVMAFASSGNGSSDHLTAELFWQQTSTTGIHIPYKGGGPVMNDLLGNQVDSSFMNINTAMPQIQAGKLRPLVITSAKRSPLLPNVPTLDELGIRDAGVTSWQALAAPRGLPADIKARIHAATLATFNDPATKAKLLELGFEMVLNTPEQFASFQAGEYARWQSLITSRKITAD